MGPSITLLFAVPKDLQKTTYDSKTMVFLGHFLWVLLCKYWIVFCTFMMAFISLQEVHIYKIIYMVLFLTFVLIFQLNFRVWRAINYAFWWLVIIYSMIVLMIIYTFQFEEFNKYWTSKINISDKVLEDIGLVKYDTAGLFLNLLSPTGFLVIVILQVRYFHQPFMKLSDPERFRRKDGEGINEESHLNMITEDEEEEEGDGANQVEGKDGMRRKFLKKMLLYVKHHWQCFTVFMWRVGEIHIFKVVMFIVLITAVYEVSALTAVYVLLIAIVLPIIHLRLLLSHLAMLWTAVIILAKMIFQLRLVDTKIWKTDCGDHGINTTSNQTFENDAVWFGLEKVDEKGVSISEYLDLYLYVLVLIGVESIIRYHQKQYYRNPDIEKPQKGIIFPDITRADADVDLMQCCKFFANYFFYKFGLECCWIMSAITATVRCDAIALIYLVMVAALIMASRKTVARVWPIYRIVLAALLAIQFLILLGFPLGACIEYPWASDSNFKENLQQWLFLPNYEYTLHSKILIADFLQLLLVCLQASVFSIESNPEVMLNYGGGDNKDILEDVEANTPIPCEDFTIHQKKAIEVIKFLIFEHMFWVTMAIIFITGATRINIFSLFYVIAVFCFMWFGKEFFLKPLRSLLSMWNLLTGYCIFVLLCKVALQLVGCVYVGDLVHHGQCWLVQLFGVNCMLYAASQLSTGECFVEKDDSGMAWDVVCLVFLLLQRRIYSSHYFRHVVDTIQAQNCLVSKGAELINRIMIREVSRQNALEKKVLVNIKQQMKALKKKQASLKKDFKEPEEHFQAIRAGDYYLFEDDESIGKPGFGAKAPTTLDIGVDEKEAEGTNPLQVIHTAHDQDMETAVSSYDSGQQQGAKSDSVHGEETDETVEEKDAQSPSKLHIFFNFLCVIWYSIIDGIIRTCNRLSRNYRLVARKLSLDLVQEKNKIVTSKVQSSQPSALDVTTESRDSVLLDDLEKLDDEEIAAQFASNKDRTTRLVMAIGLLLSSQSEMLCYFLMILDQMVYGSLLSLPLPLMVFLWGMLSVPRPSKTFWVTVITYIEAIVVCKYLFQFGFFPWNNDIINKSPFYPPRIIGIEKKSYYANVDIALLLALFLHRSILRKYGLWRDSADISADMEIAQRCEGEENPEEPTGSRIDLDEEVQPEEPSKLGQGLSYVLGPFTKFFKQVTESSYNATTDVYAPMFFCDFILFLVLVFGFSSFGPAATTGDGDVATYIQDNKIPIPFLVMLILQFIFIVIDRGLFLRKNVLGKFIFQLCLVIGIHLWMFFLLPLITERSFFTNRAAQLWYFIKCIYFGLSAYQIRCGYPTRILGNFLTKSYGILNMILFKGFLAIPFLLELRALMDWMWTDSTLAISNWLQMEDIYANIFVLKCWREIEKAYPQERSIKKSPVIKYISGGLLLCVIIFIIWFPLVFFSFFNAVFVSNPPVEARLSISIGGYQPLFSTTALGDDIRILTDAEFNLIKSFYSKDRNAFSLISGYSASDVTLIEFDGNALAIWGINPRSKQNLAADLAKDIQNPPLIITMEVKIMRAPDQALPAELTNFYRLDLRKPEYKSVRHKMAALIMQTSNDSVEIDRLFPRFMRLGSQSQALILDQLVKAIGLSNITMRLEGSGKGLNEWWNIKELLYDDSVFHLRPTGSRKEFPKASLITFNDKKAPESLSFLSGYGIIGLYISFVVLIGRLLRLSTTNQYLTIIFRELPDVNKVLQLCLDLYLVREMKEFHLEEDLYAMIIFLYRSPETMVKETRQTVRIGNLKKKKEDKKKDD
ncbi:piezo-type mechanosensitive ion channel component [Plakobranchus ocellatus]|uniref:Piezo-type mechanosensitive ion channel component n=1 Tax=Plakobranchus ocellatus TaxID=259542 RepID=A0AAV4CFV5_9GAST|nr:piezo-type mechanosensitive ion channel component [Plakobranchus ocellatus]